MGDPHPLIAAFRDALVAADRASTAASYLKNLVAFQTWMAGQGVDLADATRDLLVAYQHWISQAYRTPAGAPLGRTTVVTRIVVVKALYAWLHRRGLLLTDPAARLVAPAVPQRLTVAKDHLTQQEVTALLATAADRAATADPGSWRWALAYRDLAAVALAVATGRRCQGLCDLRVSDLDLDRCEVRVEREKGATGRVLPVAAWAVAATRRYLAGPRQRLLGDRPSDHLLVSHRAARLSAAAYALLLEDLVAATIAANPDLVELPGKRVTSHALRVTFAATLLFPNGCTIRSLNELMLHTSLSVTARYTPVALEDLRRALLTAHPRA
jgi:integrase/recombinase XerC